MAFEKLQGLGPEKFQKITNSLLTGTAAQALARTIRTDWGDLSDTAEKTLTQQLNRLRIAMAKGAFGADAQKALDNPESFDIKILRHSNLNALQELTALAEVQRTRLQLCWNDERKSKKYNPHINPIVSQLQETLLAIQKIRFDLGMDEFKGVVPGVKLKSESATLPDGTQMQRTMFDIVGVAEQIIQKRLGAM